MYKGMRLELTDVQVKEDVSNTPSVESGVNSQIAGVRAWKIGFGSAMLKSGLRTHVEMIGSQGGFEFS